jgi:hypothetical protein
MEVFIADYVRKIAEARKNKDGKKEDDEDQGMVGRLTAKIIDNIQVSKLLSVVIFFRFQSKTFIFAMRTRLLHASIHGVLLWMKFLSILAIRNGKKNTLIVLTRNINLSP